MQEQPDQFFRLDACSGKACSWGSEGGTLECFNGSGDCLQARFLEAEVSEFHDATLAAATAQIRSILAGIPADKAGRTLSFINTKMGSLLVWVHHRGQEMPATAVTSLHDDATVAKTLGLKNVTAQSASQY